MGLDLCSSKRPNPDASNEVKVSQPVHIGYSYTEQPVLAASNSKKMLAADQTKLTVDAGKLGLT
jgi:hypothetical protein